MKQKFVTIVRNPYERIVSDLFWYKLINKNSSQEEVFEKLNILLKRKIVFYMIITTHPNINFYVSIIILSKIY